MNAIKMQCSILTITFLWCLRQNFLMRLNINSTTQYCNVYVFCGSSWHKSKHDESDARPQECSTRNNRFMTHPRFRCLYDSRTIRLGCTFCRTTSRTRRREFHRCRYCRFHQTHSHIATRPWQGQADCSRDKIP